MTETSIPAPLAVVTGASSGIGRALAVVLVEHGHDVLVAAEGDAVHTVADALGGAPRVRAVQVDLATHAGVEALTAAVTEGGRPPSVLALNAGVGVGGPFVSSDLEDELRLIDLNVRSTVHLAKLLLPTMVRAGGGRVLVTSSIAAVAPGPFHATYAASKAFVHSFAEAVRQELTGTGVTVTSLMPGPTDTDFFARAGMDDTPLGRSDAKDDPGTVARDAYDALVDGRSSIVAGSFRNRLQAELGTHLPDALAAPLMARMTRPDDA